MKRYFDIRDQKVTAVLNIEDGSSASCIPDRKFGKLFHSKDVRELTLSQYRKLSKKYTSSKELREEDLLKFMPITKRSELYIGQEVEIVLKKDQRTGTLTKGKIARILTKSEVHTRGIKVMLQDGQVGRVQKKATD